ncbi:hypothetical protein BMF29_12390 [Comamonas kerstersii]|nr:hypothetical protein BMF38_13585 [Comamonas kerstersii]OOH90596.1 hypothetical protein BMF29_12390 [Comamonas kerstersii]
MLLFCQKKLQTPQSDFLRYFWCEVIDLRFLMIERAKSIRFAWRCGGCFHSGVELNVRAFSTFAWIAEQAFVYAKIQRQAAIKKNESSQRSCLT